MCKDDVIDETVLDGLKALVEDYIRGEKSAEEVRDHAGRIDGLAPLLPRCLGCNSIPHDLLEAAGYSPFESMITFNRELTITRDGLKRNLLLAREGTLAPAGVEEWITDWFSWQVAERPDDEVVLELAGELMMGEETITAIVGSEASLETVLWHIDNTPSAMGENVSLGLTVIEHMQEIANQLRMRLTDEISEDALRDYLRRSFSDHRETFPALVDDICDAIGELNQAPRIYEAIDRFLLCLARTADPMSCAEQAREGSELE